MAPQLRTARLQHCTWAEVEAYLDRSRGIIVPIGSTEQHGPNGLIGTDALAAEGIALAAGASADALVGPVIAFGAAQFNLAFPGTVSARPSTIIALIFDYVGALARQGFERFYFLNGHGGNVAPARTAFQEIYDAYSRGGDESPGAIRCRIRSWWDLPAPDRLRRGLYGDAEGMHCTPSEIAVIQHLYPEAAALEKPTEAPAALPKDFLRDHAWDDHADAATHRARFPDGRVGSDSSLATPEHGNALFQCAVADAAADYLSFVAATA